MGESTADFRTFTAVLIVMGISTERKRAMRATVAFLVTCTSGIGSATRAASTTVYARPRRRSPTTATTATTAGGFYISTSFILYTFLSTIRDVSADDVRHSVAASFQAIMTRSRRGTRVSVSRYVLYSIAFLYVTRKLNMIIVLPCWNVGCRNI